MKLLNVTQILHKHELMNWIDFLHSFKKLQNLATDLEPVLVLFILLLL